MPPLDRLPAGATPSRHRQTLQAAAAAGVPRSLEDHKFGGISMKFALQFPMRAMNKWDEWIAGHSLGELAVAAEDVGFDLVSSTDHPFPDAAWLKGGGHHAFDPFVSLAFMAAP